MAKDSGLGRQSLVAAGFVMDNAPDLGVEIMKAGLSLREAEERTRERIQAREAKINSLDRVRCEAPDLAALVDQEKMTLAEALGALRVREEERRRELYTLTKNFADGLTMLDPSSVDPQQQAQRWLTADAALLSTAPDFDVERVQRIADSLTWYVVLKKGHSSDGKAEE